MRHISRIGMMVFLITVLFFIIRSSSLAQNLPSGKCDTTEVQKILDDINLRRITVGILTPLVFNDSLCNLAYTQALVVASGPANYPSNNPRLRNEPGGGISGVRDWVKKTEFKPYPDGSYAVDIRTFSTQLYTFETVVEYMFDEEADVIDIFMDGRWREIGIAERVSTFNGIDFNHYVFIAGAQPNVLPTIGYVPNYNEHIGVKEFLSTNVTFWLSNENYYTGPDENTVGPILNVAINENPANLDKLSCPPVAEDGTAWQLYNPQMQYNVGGESGPVSVYIRVCDSIRRSFKFEAVFNVVGNKPGVKDTSADFDAAPTSGEIPLDVKFTDRSAGIISKWEWDFNGDGRIDSTEQSPSFRFTQAADYVVKLTVTDQQGNTDSHEQVISVTAPPPPPQKPPTAMITPSVTSGFAPLVVDFSAAQLTGNIDTYVWDFNDDGLSDSNAVDPQWRFEQPGEYIVRLNVSGPGGSDTDSLTITVQQLVPIAPRFSADPSRGPVPLDVQFTDTSTGPVVTWEWDFDSNTFVDSPEQNPFYTYDTPGTYIAKMTACDAAGICDFFEQNIVVEAPPLDCPVAGFSVNPMQGTVPLKVEFTNTSTGQIDRVVWDFESDNTGDSNDLSVSHVYSTPDNYTVKLTVSNACGSDSIQQQIAVKAVEPPAKVTTIPTAEATADEILVTPEATALVEAEPPPNRRIVSPTFAVPLTLVWTNTYAVLVNSSGEVIKASQLEDIVFEGTGGSSYPASQWIIMSGTVTPLEEIHPERCLTVYSLNNPLPGLAEVLDDGIECVDIRAHATGAEFWEQAPIQVRRDGVLLAECASSPCVFDLEGSEITPGQDSGSAATPSGLQGWLLLSWNNDYMLVRNISDTQISGDVMRQIAIPHTDGTFQGRLWGTTDLDANKCMVIMRADTNVEIILSGDNSPDSACIGAVARAQTIHPFWTGSQGQFTVQIDSRDLIVCDNSAKKCTVPAP